jgi:ABC-type nickel/cobalt efflux system permease component RcnA
MRRLVLLVLALAALAAPASALAHPLGNFTLNRYTRIEAAGDRLYVLYVLDMAEIPAYQEKQKIRDEGTYARQTAAEIGRGLEVAVDGRRVVLEPLGHALAFPPGVGGLRTLRLQAVYESEPLRPSGGPLRLTLKDRNFAGRIGWKEIVLRARDGATVFSSSVPAESVSEETLAYPKNLLQSPLDVTAATATFVPGTRGAPPPRLLSPEELEARVAVRATGDGGFASLIGRDDLTPLVVFVSLLVAFFWGAAHAFSPGHGKAVVAAYLVGSRGTSRHAVYLGLIVTVTHTIGVFALGLVTLALSEFVVPEQLYPWLNVVSAFLVVSVGITVLRWRVREWRRGRPHASHGHVHDHHGHAHAPEAGGGMRGLLGMGISGGIIPCPTALVVLLAAISLHRVAYGLVLILAFSIGLAAAMTAFGLLAVTAKRAFARLDFERSAVRLLPAASALVIVGLGLAMIVRSIPGVI